MSTMPRFPAESSITFSLKELVELENERVADESARAARALRDENERIAAKRAEEERDRERASAEREEERRAAAVRDDAIRAQHEGQAAALRDIARLEAEAKVRLAADEAVRAHELVVLRERLQGRSTATKWVLGALCGLAIAAAFGLSMRASARETELTRNTATLTSDKQRVVGERDAAKDAEVRAMEGEKRAEARIQEERTQRLRALDGSVATLSAWASERRRPEIVARAKAALVRARTNPTDDALAASEKAVDEARAELATPVKKGGAVVTIEKGGCVDPHDPLCGLNGRGL